MTRPARPLTDSNTEIVQHMDRDHKDPLGSQAEAFDVRVNIRGALGTRIVLSGALVLSYRKHDDSSRSHPLRNGKWSSLCPEIVTKRFHIMNPDCSYRVPLTNSGSVD
jgi:hypothetical protein